MRLYRPESSETAVRVAPVAALVTVTLAPFRAAPEGSATVPARVAVFTPCAWDIPAQTSTHTASSAMACSEAVHPQRQPQFVEVDAHTPCLHSMTPPSLAPANLPLPLAVAVIPPLPCVRD